MLRIILSVIAGIIAGGISVAILEFWLMYELFEMPDSMIPDDPESVAAHIKEIPRGAQWLVVIAQFLGAFMASFVAGRISDSNRKASLTAGVIMCLFTVMNLFTISHPPLMTVAMPLAAVLGVFIGIRGTD